MKKKLTVLSCALVALATLVAFVGSPAAQEKQPSESPAAQEKQPSESPAAEKPARAAPRGRLPNYYRQVVTLEQREEIYKIQKSYAAQIEPLEMQIAALEMKRDQEVEAVLSAEQLEKVKALVAEAKQLRAERAAERAKERADSEK